MSRLTDMKNATRRILAYVLRLTQRQSNPTETGEPVTISAPNVDTGNAFGERPAHYYGQVDKGHWIHLEDILKQVDTCAAMVRELKRVNPSVHSWYRQFGAHIVPHGTMFAVDGLSEKFMQNWPSNGMVLQPSVVDDNGEEYLPHLMFFDKVSRTSVCKTEKVTLQPTTKRIYRVSQVIKSPDISYPFGCSFFVGVSDTGEVELLKQRVGMMPKFRRSQSGTPGWDYPQALWFMYSSYCRNTLEKGKTPDSIQQWTSTLFCVAANAFARATETAQVRIKSSGTVVNVGIPLSRCPYFFRDRNIEAASDGRRKRIFHFVRGHERKLADGRKQNVRGHYRGARRFEWNGHPVTITVPDKHVTPDQWNVEMHEFKRAPKGADWLTADDAGARVADCFENGVSTQTDSNSRAA